MQRGTSVAAADVVLFEYNSQPGIAPVIEELKQVWASAGRGQATVEGDRLTPSRVLFAAFAVRSSRVGRTKGRWMPWSVHRGQMPSPRWGSWRTTSPPPESREITTDRPSKARIDFVIRIAVKREPSEMTRLVIACCESAGVRPCNAEACAWTAWHIVEISSRFHLTKSILDVIDYAWLVAFIGSPRSSVSPSIGKPLSSRTTCSSRSTSCSTKRSLSRSCSTDSSGVTRGHVRRGAEESRPTDFFVAARSSTSSSGRCANSSASCAPALRWTPWFGPRMAAAKVEPASRSSVSY